MEKTEKTHFVKVVFLFLLLEQLSMAKQLLTEKESDKVTIQPFLNFQLWGLNQHYQIEGHQINQMLVLFRRGRFGANARIGNRWKMQIQIGMDGLGLESIDTIKKSVFYPSALNIWSVQTQYKVFRRSEFLYLNVGYMLPHISREAITSPWNVSSLDKMRSSVALRYFVTGKANGISPAITLGGLLAKKKLYYSAALMPNAFYTSKLPQIQSPLLLGHVLFSLVGNEYDHYHFVLPTNGYKQAVGITLGVGGSYQGNTEVFQSNVSFGGNVLISIYNFQVDAEYYQLLRTNNEERFQGYTYHMRGTYSFPLKQAHLQTTIAFWESKCDNHLYHFPVYRENAFDGGIDYVPKTKPLKVGIHYTYSLAKNKFTYAPGLQSGKYLNAVTLKLQATIN